MLLFECGQEDASCSCESFIYSFIRVVYLIIVGVVDKNLMWPLFIASWSYKGNVSLFLVSFQWQQLKTEMKNERKEIQNGNDISNNDMDLFGSPSNKRNKIESIIIILTSIILVSLNASYYYTKVKIRRRKEKTWVDKGGKSTILIRFKEDMDDRSIFDGSRRSKTRLK